MNPFNTTGKRARLIGTALLLITFVAGGLAGAASERVMHADDQPPKARTGEMRGGARRLLLDEQFAQELQLSAEQRAQIDQNDFNCILVPVLHCQPPLGH